MRQFTHYLALVALCLLGALATTRATATETAADETPRKTAIFVNNLGGESLAKKAPVLEAAIAARLNGHGFSILSAQEIAESIRKSGQSERDLGQQLANDSSARALARTLGADYLLVAHLMSYNKRQMQYQGNNINTLNERYRLRVGYGLLESAQGSGLIGETFVVEATERASAGLHVNDQGRLSDLIDEAASRIAADAIAKAEAGKIAKAPTQANEVSFSVSARLQGIALPNVSIGDNGRATISAETFPVEAMGATVELDGVVIGSAPGTFRASPGLHQMRVSRPGFETWARNVNIREGFELVAALEFTPEGLAHWKNMSAFMQQLKDDAQLSAAQVELIQGAAQALRQSGYRVDTKQAPATIIQQGGIWEPVIVNPQLQRGPGPVIINQGETDQAPAQPQAQQEANTIYLKDDGNIYWGQEQVSAEQLDSRLAALAAKDGQAAVWLQASPSVPYSRVTPILEKTRAHQVRLNIVGK